MSVFFHVREKAYQRLLQDPSFKENPQEANKLTISFMQKFEIEYIDELRNKLKGCYSEHIQTKEYNVPNDVDFKNLKNFGASSEIIDLSESIAGWSFELEVLSYTLEGIKLYGLQDFKGVEKKDYVSILKRGYSYKKTSIKSISEFLIKKLVNVTLDKFSSAALAGGLSKIQLGGGALMEIFLTFSMTGQMPWTLVLSYLNLPWLLGGLVCSLFLKKLNDYATKEVVLANLGGVLNTFENNKLSLMSERQRVLDMAILILGKEEREKKDIKKLGVMIDGLLNPKDETSEGNTEDIQKMYDVHDCDDYVMIDQKEHKEYQDTESGIVVVDFE